MEPLTPVGVLAISSDESICNPLLSYTKGFLFVFLQPLKDFATCRAGKSWAVWLAVGKLLRLDDVFYFDKSQRIFPQADALQLSAWQHQYSRANPTWEFAIYLFILATII